MKLDSKMMDTRGEKAGVVGRLMTSTGFHLTPGAVNVMGYLASKHVTLQGKRNIADRTKVTN